MEQQPQIQRLETSLKQHELELAQVAAAMQVTDDNTKEELKQLMVDLEQLVQLTKETLCTMKNKQSLSRTENLTLSQPSSEPQNANNDMDIEFNLFQAEIASLEQPTQSSEPVPSCSSEFSLHKDLEALEGTKCQAPFSQDWGEHSYHNALVLSAEPSDNISSLDDIKVRVMFCNPLNQAMQPCPYFLDGSCRFTEENCRFSHGHIVQLSELKEFHNPDYSLLQRDSKCLARYSDKLWYKATVEEVQSDHRYVVKFEKYNNVATVDLEDVLPLEHGEHESSSDTENESYNKSLEEDEDEAEVLVSPWPTPTSCALGEWEKHTRGIGSKLLEKMGYIFGQGLGKNGEGRTEPVEAVILPQGKSLDKCIELRENALSGDPLRQKRKQLLKQKRHDAKVAAGYNYERSSVFDFLNKKIGQTENACPSSASKKNTPTNLKSTSTKNLNVQSLKLGEDIRKSEQELQRLQVQLNRNQNSDKVVSAQLKNKIAASEEHLVRLRNTEKSIQREQMSRKDHKKLTIF